MFGELKSKQFEALLEKAVEAEWAKPTSEEQRYQEAVDCFLQLLSLLNADDFQQLAFPDYRDCRHIVVDGKVYDFDRDFRHGDSVAVELLGMLDSLMAEGDPEIFLKEIEKRLQTVYEWCTAYRELELCGGKITFLSEDSEDMLEISYDDGMLIDLGKPEAEKNYYITVVSSNDEAGWAKPLAEIAVSDKRMTADKLQETILRFRRG